MSEFQPQQKILNFLDEYIKSASFHDKILQLRKEIGIPAQGLDIMEDELSSLIKDRMAIFRIAVGVVSTENRKRVNIKLREIYKDFPVSNIYIFFAFELYFYYNKYVKELFEQALFLENVCKLVPARADMFEYCADDPAINHIYIEHQDTLTEKYPIALYISPDATQRDIVQYVRGVWNLFVYYRKDYKNKKSKVGKIKKKKDFIRERNELIFKNQHLPRKKIMELLTDKYGADRTIDYAYIGKIISLEKKKRKQM